MHKIFSIHHMNISLTLQCNVNLINYSIGDVINLMQINKVLCELQCHLNAISIFIVNLIKAMLMAHWKFIKIAWMDSTHEYANNVAFMTLRILTLGDWETDVMGVLYQLTLRNITRDTVSSHFWLTYTGNDWPSTHSLRFNKN